MDASCKTGGESTEAIYNNGPCGAGIFSHHTCELRIYICQTGGDCGNQSKMVLVSFICFMLRLNKV